MSSFLKNIPEPSRFKNANGVLLTKNLFFETSSNNDSAIYTLKDDDHTYEGKTYLSLYKLYMTEDDPTEYLFAKKHLDSWQHWEALCRAPWFKPYRDRFRAELDLRLRAEALQRIKAESKSSSKNAFTANKFLLQGQWITSESKRGRPSKDEINRKAIEMAQDTDFLDEDFARVINLSTSKLASPAKPGTSQDKH